MKNVRRILCAVFLLCLVLPARAESKLAFVIGIDRYPNLEAGVQLQRAVSDANAVGDTLQSLGFQVTRVTSNATLDTILNRFDAFKASIQPGDTVVFFYSGHGISLDDGNYLIPADIPSLGNGDQRRAKRLAIAERDFSRDIRNAGARVAVIVIDACRNNPFPVQGTRALGDGQRGLARLETSEGVFSLYSAREGQSALDRLPDNDTDPNSVFTRVFLKELKTPGVSLSDLGERVRDEVAALAHSAGYSQVPAVYNDLLGARLVFLAGAPSPVVSGAAAPPAQTGEQVARLETPTVDPTVHECDRLTAAPTDNFRPRGVFGVAYAAIDPQRAVPACQAAHDTHPNEPRLSFELGRALDKAGNPAKAFTLYQAAANADYTAGMCDLASSYETGNGVAQDLQQAVFWYRKAADAGDGDGMRGLGYMYEHGSGVAKDPQEAVLWYRKAADAGDAIGMRNLAVMYQNGSGIGKDLQQAAVWYRKAAEAGDAAGMTNLGVLYDNGTGVAQDSHEAARWYRNAAEAGDSMGMNNLGFLYAQGSGVPKDPQEAVIWYRKAADAGLALGMRNLGVMYDDGTGVSKDPQQAVLWYRKAADAGDAIGMNNLGVMYQDGTGVPKDPAQSAVWYQKAADAGEGLGMRNLGGLYAAGRGVVKDAQKAIFWYQKGAAAGDATSMKELGFIYARGNGVAKNDRESVRWYQAAAKAGDQDSKTYLQSRHIQW